MHTDEYDRTVTPGSGDGGGGAMSTWSTAPSGSSSSQSWSTTLGGLHPRTRVQ